MLELVDLSIHIEPVYIFFKLIKLRASNIYIYIIRQFVNFLAENEDRLASY